MRTKLPNRTPNKARNMSIRQPARRPLGPTKTGFKPNVRRELDGKVFVDKTGRFSAALSRFAKVIFSLLNQGRSGYQRNRSRQTGIRQSDLRFVLSAVPIQVVSGRQKTLQRISPRSERIARLLAPARKTRTHLRRYVRRTNAHSRKLANHKACVALWVAWYNFCRTNTAIRCTPAMEAGLTNHIWTISELLEI